MSILASIAFSYTDTESDNSLNLDSLLIQLQDKVTPKWYQFGVALGIENAILDRCLSYHPEQSIIEILDHWLRNDTKQSWGEVARALRQINYHQLAKEIDKKGKKQNNLCSCHEINIKFYAPTRKISS